MILRLFLNQPLHEAPQVLPRLKGTCRERGRRICELPKRVSQGSAPHKTSFTTLSSKHNNLPISLLQAQRPRNRQNLKTLAASTASTITH